MSWNLREAQTRKGSKRLLWVEGGRILEGRSARNSNGSIQGDLEEQEKRTAVVHNKRFSD